MLIKTRYPNHRHGCDFLCFNLWRINEFEFWGHLSDAKRMLKKNRDLFIKILSRLITVTVNEKARIKKIHLLRDICKLLENMLRSKQEWCKLKLEVICQLSVRMHWAKQGCRLILTKFKEQAELSLQIPNWEKWQFFGWIDFFVWWKRNWLVNISWTV